MGGERVQGIQGWLLVYVIGSIPVLLFVSAGLSGWFFEYPIGLFVAILLLLASPLLLILLKSAKAPRWNIAALWIAAILITVRIVSGVLFGRVFYGQPPLSGEALIAAQDRLLGAMPILLGTVFFSFGWATVWTRYFTRSMRVRNTFK
jgi:heme/copper-type cytochrome/quinol oxidase subunit 4